MYFSEYEADRPFYLYLRMLLVRRAEEALRRLFTEGRISGTTHLCIGQEADAVAVGGALDPGRDVMFSNHRCHGHYLAFGGSLEGLLGEIMGRECGVCGGAGGSQHLKTSRFFSSGIQGGLAPIAAGAALAEKRKGSGAVAVCWLGDGTLGEGVVYESLNMASLWDVPVFYVVENNRWAQTTPVGAGVAGDIARRGEAFGIRSEQIESSDVLELEAWAARMVEYVRGQGRPLWGVIHTQRLCAHSKGDDTRTSEQVEACKAFDPLGIHGARLDAARLEQAEALVAREIEQAMERVEASPEPRSVCMGGAS